MFGGDHPSRAAFSVFSLAFFRRQQATERRCTITAVFAVGIDHKKWFRFGAGHL